MKVNILYVIPLLLLFGCGEKQTVTRYTSWQSSQTEEKIIRQTLRNFEKNTPTYRINSSRFQEITRKNYN